MKKALKIVSLTPLFLGLTACPNSIYSGPVNSAAAESDRPLPTTSIGRAGQYNSIAAAESVAAHKEACERMGMVLDTDTAYLDTQTDLETVRDTRGRYGTDRRQRTESRAERSTRCVNPAAIGF